MASIQFTDADRDADGYIKAPARNPEPRSLADLLPSAGAPTAPAKRPMTKAEQISLLVVVTLAIGVLAYSVSRGGDAPAVAPLVPARAAQASGDSVSKPSPIPATAPAVSSRLLVAFAAPNGDPLGAIESTRPLTPTAHYGETWVQADVQGSGLVWLRRSDAPELAITGPDLAPVPTARPAVVVAPPPTPEPQPPCLTAGANGQTVTVCGWGNLEDEAKAKWIVTYGGNAGVVLTPTPYGGKP